MSTLMALQPRRILWLSCVCHCTKAAFCAVNSQINLQSESAQIMVADKIVEQLDPYFRSIVEEIVTGVPTYE